MPIGDVICFEVAYDDLVRSSVAAGAQLLVVQTNNATFGHTAETYQQLAMSRLRAVESGRTVVQVATTGKSAVIGPDGGMRAAVRRRCSASAVLVRTVPVRAAQTLATRVGAWPEYALAALALAGLIGVAVRDRRGAHVSTVRGLRRSQPGGDGGYVSAGTEAAAEVLVIIPTYNERENIEPIVARLFAATPAAHVLVVDDGSPDGTGKIADELADDDARVHVLHRTRKDGSGCGLHRRLRLGPGRAATTCSSRWTPTARTRRSSCRGCCGALGGADVVLGSRWVPGGTVVNWPLRRQVISRGGNLYTRLALGLQLRDATGGLPRLPARGARGDRLRRGGLAGLLLPGRPRLARACAPGSASSRCRSRSSSASGASRR